MFLITLIPSCCTGLLKGALRGLGLLNRIVKYHVVVQIFLITPFFVFFGFCLEQTKGLPGLWIGNMLSETLISLCYLREIYRQDWHDISREVIIKIAQESKNAGCLQLTQSFAMEKARE